MTPETRSLRARASARLFRLAVFLLLIVFFPFDNLRWWQGWVFVALFWLCSAATTAYLAINDPQLLERRMKAGSRAEQGTQKTIIRLLIISFSLAIALPVIDHHRGWSQVPLSMVFLGEALIVLGFVGVWAVFRENTYGASTIQLAQGQTVISTGPYGIVRHPMYSMALVMFGGIPLALGSWWGLLTVLTNFAVLAWRLLDEERFLAGNLPGYSDYLNRVRYRLVPLVW